MPFQEVPKGLEQVEFARIVFGLEFQESCQLNPGDLLRLRRDLLQAASGAFSDPLQRVSGKGSERYQELFDPKPSHEPEGRRRHQKPGPPFSILIDPDLTDFYEPGDRLDLEVVFWGKGISRIGDFLLALQVLGRQGIARGQGLFDPVTASVLTSSAELRAFWKEGQATGSLAPSISSAAWELDRINLLPDELDLVFLTPARLLSNQKPLFKPTFSQIFPFILRRVTSVLFSHCGFEGVQDPKYLISLASTITEVRTSLVWEDWRFLEGEKGLVDLGGVSGTVRLRGEAVRSLYWVLHLGSLMNIGRGASFGAGRFRLDF